MGSAGLKCFTVRVWRDAGQGNWRTDSPAGSEIHESIDGVLNAFGSQGWELVGVASLDEPGRAEKNRAFFKAPV